MITPVIWLTEIFNMPEINLYWIDFEREKSLDDWKI